jgi:hypothetical protein
MDKTNDKTNDKENDKTNNKTYSRNNYTTKKSLTNTLIYTETTAYFPNLPDSPSSSFKAEL